MGVKPGQSLVFLTVVLVFSALWSRYQAYRMHLEVVERAKQCRENIKKIGIAAQMYQCDYGANYPSDIDQLGPEYLSPHPGCPFDGSRYQAYIVNITEASRDHFPEGLMEISPGCPGLVVSCTSAVHKTFEPDLEPGYGFWGFFQANSKLLLENP
jgi:hypothetical protein